MVPASRQLLFHPTFQVSPLGPGIPISHALSVKLQAPLNPVQPSTRPAPLFVTPPYFDAPSVSLTDTSVLSEHFNFTWPIQSTLLVSYSQLDLSECLLK